MSASSINLVKIRSRILKYRMRNMALICGSELQVAGVSGDVRRVLQLCRKAAEICEEEGTLQVHPPYQPMQQQPLTCTPKTI
jgi:Cdc6-like AAA superfamily ATPase